MKATFANMKLKLNSTINTNEIIINKDISLNQ